MFGILNFVELEKEPEYPETHVELNTCTADSDTVPDVEICYGDCFGLSKQ